jgi:SAM-dependent methyltransferase
MTDPTTPQARAAFAYNSASDLFDAPALSFWDRFGRRTVERIALQPGESVLDVCCGSGASALPAAERVGPTGRVLGVDIAERLLALARAKAARRGLRHARFELADMETLDDRFGDFDAVICVFGIFFLPDMAAALRRLWFRVRPGGTLAVTTWGRGLFEPCSTMFWQAVRRERPELYKGFNPWDQVDSPDGMQALFDEARVGPVAIDAEPAEHPLSGPEDWWTIVLGSGFRGTVEQLTPDARKRVRQDNLGRIETEGIRSVNASVLYAVARRPEA